MREPRDFSAGIVLVHDTSLCCPHDDGFCRLKGRQGGFAIAALDRFLDLAHRISQHRAPSLLTSVRRAITRVALRADLVLAINLSFAAGASSGPSAKSD